VRAEFHFTTEPQGLISRIAESFRDEHRFYRLLLLFSAVTAVLKGMHMPYSWPVTQAQIDYRDGFVRRGLLGEVCRRLHIPIWHYQTFSLLSFVLLACLLTLLAWSVRRSGLDRIGLGSFTALVASGFFVTMLVNLVGFLDIILLLILLLVLQVRDPRWQLLAATASAVMAILFHELYVIAFLPISLIGPVSWAVQGGRASWRRWLLVAMAAAVPWIVVMRIARESNMTPAQSSEMQRQIRARVDFEPYDVMLNEVLTNSNQQSRKQMFTLVKEPEWWVVEGFGLAAFLPTAIFFLMIAWRAARAQPRMVRWYMIGSALAPLLLNIVAYDRFRWLMMVAIDAVLCAVVACWLRRPLQGENGLPEFGIAWRRAAVFLIAVNLATDIGFFSGHARNFPFFDYGASYHVIRRNHQPLLWPIELMRRQD
jgi:hypothetical protein